MHSSATPAPIVRDMMSESRVSEGEPDDRDTMHTLALANMPLARDTMKRARIIKNSRLDSVIEMYRDKDVGSGQIEVEKLPLQFTAQALPAEDFNLIRMLSLMPSYDVYSLRVTLRAAGVRVGDHAALQLSPTKTKELSAYMTNFTRPLLLQVYGEEGAKIETFDDVVALFRDPDMQRARHKLSTLAGKLGIDIMGIPKFLEDYADIFLSLSYYKQRLDEIAPSVDSLFLAFGDLSKSYQMRTNVQLMTACKDIESTFTQLLTSVTGRLESFDRYTRDMWDNLSAERFRKIEAVIKAFHTMMGGILCALTVKLDAWNRLFPTSAVGGPGRRADFILGELCHGMRKIRELEKAAAIPAI